MRSLKKLTSVLLVAIMVLSIFAMMPMTVSAATDSTITVSSNITDDVTYTYNEYTEQVTVNYYLTYDQRILDQQSVLTYDADVLQLADTNTEESFCPVMASGTMINAETPGQIIFASTTTDFYNFTEGGVFFTATFDVIGTGDANVNLDVEILTGTTAKSLPQYTEATEVPLVYESAVLSDGFTFTADATLTGEGPIDPPVTEATLKFAAPTAVANRYNWTLKDVVLYYGNSTTFADNTLVPMTATADKYYTEDTGSNTLISGGNGWTIYEVTLTAEQVAAAEAAKFVGFGTTDTVNRTTLVSGSNILKAGVDTYGAYGDANTLATLNGKTFVIKDSEWGATSAISYKGYWLTDYNTIKFAAPVSLTKNSNWDDVEFYYSNGGTFDTATKLAMVNTLDTTKVTEPGCEYLRAGNWYIYAVSVDANTAAEIETATNAGFAKPGASNKTGFSRNVFKAKVNEYDGAYLDTAKTLDEVEGLVFVVEGTASATSLLTFHGEWQTETKYTEGNDDLITIRFAAPIGVNKIDTWDTGVELYYGSTTKYRETERITMTDTGETVNVSVDGTTLETVTSGDWKIYEVQLNLEQVKAIDNANAVGFIKAGAWNRTSTNFYRSIVRASKIDGETKYSGVKESIETYDGLTFVLNGEYDSRYETTTYLGSWIG